MENKFYKVLNEILNDFIPKTKFKKFRDLILENDLEITKLTYFEKEEKPNRQKVPIEEIRKRLKKKITEVKEPYLEVINTSDQGEVLKSCDSLADKIIYEDKRNKIYYYYFGKHLLLLKEHYCLIKTVKEFYEFIDERYKIKLSTLFKYIKFFNLCKDYKVLLYCDLSFSEIMNNVPEIREFLSS